MKLYTYDDFERAVAAGDAVQASIIEAYLLEDPYPTDESPPAEDTEEDFDESAELRKAALSRGQP